MLGLGLNTPDILDPGTISRLVLAALPHYGDYVGKFGSKGFPYIVEPLESELLKELQRMLRGEESDSQSIEQAAKIMREVKNVNEKISKSSST